MLTNSKTSLGKINSLLPIPAASIITIYNYFQLCNDVFTYPNGYASYAVPVRRYRYLQSRLLQCMDHSTPPCGLLKLRSVTSVFKRLSLSGFLFLRTIFTIQGAPKVLLQEGLTQRSISSSNSVQLKFQA